LRFINSEADKKINFLNSFNTSFYLKLGMILEPNYIEKILEFIHKKSVGSLNHQFLNSLSKFLAELLQVEYVLVDEYSLNNPDIAKTIVNYCKNSFAPNITYELADTPCKNVINKKLCSYPSNIQKLFPKDVMLVKMKAQSYIGIPLWSAKGEPIGLMAILGTKELKNIDAIETALQIVAIKAAQVLEKILFETVFENQINQLKESQENYQHLFNENPISLWEEDFTYGYRKMQELLTSGIKDIKKYYHNNPDFFDECISNIKISNVNNASVNLFNAKDKDDLLNNIHKIRTKETLVHYEKILVGILNGKKEIIHEVVFKDFLDNKVVGIVKVNLFKNNKRNELKAIISISDITERVEYEKALLKSEEKFRNIVENTSEWIWELNTEGEITYSNPIVKKILGYSSEELIGKNNFALISKFDRKRILEIFLDKIEKNEGWVNLEISWTHKNGSHRFLESNAVPIIDEKGILIGYRGINRDITERKISEIEMKKLSTVVEQSANSIIITDTEGTIEYVNRKFTEITGYTSEEAIGENPRVLNSGTQPKEYFINLWKTIKEGNIWQGQFMNKAKNGHLFWEDTTISPIKNDQGKIVNFLAVKQDITELKENQKLLEKQNEELNLVSSELSKKNRLLLDSKNRFSNLFEQSPISLWEEDFTDVKQLIESINLDTDSLKVYLDENPDFVCECISKLKILNVNKATLEMSGVETKEELINNFASNFSQKSINVFKDELIAVSSNQKNFIQETEFVRTDGEIITVIIKLGFVDEGNIIIVSLVDVSAIKKAEERLKAKNKKLKIAKEKAEESDRLKTEFLNNMSHEIRTPLNGILGFSEILCDSDTTENKRKYFGNIIKNSGNQLMQVIDDILEISKLGTKQVTANNKEVCLNTLMLQLFSVFEIRAKENKIPLYLKKGLLDAESTILTDELKLNKILSNLLENAFKFTNEGYIEFGYILNKNKPAQLEIYVKDTGVGINKINQKLIFERFSQEEKELSKKFGGLGLGLSIAKENSELLDGTITLESEKGKGATFTVIIPYSPTNSSFKISKEKITKKTTEAKPTILIAEDEEVNYLFLETLLHDSIKLDCTILHAKNGIEAVDICNDNSAISLILMDIKMPFMNGFEATKLIKEMNPNLPIIAQTAYSTSEEINKSIEVGCNDFISKPINKKTLIEILNKHLKIKKA